MPELNPYFANKNLKPQLFKAHLALFLVALIYGANYTIAKVVMNNDYIQPKGFILMRVTFGAIFFLLIHNLFVKEKILRKDIPRFILCGLTGVTINQLFFFGGLKKTIAINASLLMMTTPILVLILASFLSKEKITGRKIFGIILGAIGAYALIVGSASLEFNADRAMGDIMILINASSYAFYLILVKKLMAHYNPFTVLACVFSIGFMFVLPFGFNDIKNVKWTSFPTHVWFAVGYVLICATFLAYLFNTYALSVVNASVVSIYIYLQPLLASIIAIFFGGEVLTLTRVLAGGLIFFAVFLVSFGPKANSA